MGQKSFLLYTDSLDILEHLSDEQSGKLFKAIRSYISGDILKLDPLLMVAFVPIRNQIDRDLEKYNNICERNKVNGSKGGRPKKPKKPTGLSGNPKNPSKPKKAYNDNDTDNDTDIKKKNIKKKTPTDMPEGFEPSLANKSYAERHGIDLCDVLERFIAKTTAEGKQYVDWHAGLSTYLQNEKKWNKTSPKSKFHDATDDVVWK